MSICTAQCRETVTHLMRNGNATVSACEWCYVADVYCRKRDWFIQRNNTARYNEPMLFFCS